MGNSLNIFKRENEDLPEIRHYHEFFNHEKKKIFEQNPDSKMLIDSSISKTPICDLTNCMTLMSFSKKKVIFKKLRVFY